MEDVEKLMENSAEAQAYQVGESTAGQLHSSARLATTVIPSSIYNKCA